MSLQDSASQETIAGWQANSFPRNNLDFCRFWLAVLVIFSHSFTLAVGNEDAEPLGILTRGQLNSGPFAVRCFFIISGFLISHSWVRSKSYLEFLSRRISRIYPGFIVCVLISTFIIAPFVTDEYRFDVKDLGKLLVSLVTLRDIEIPGTFATNPYPGDMNGSLWSIPYEFKWYLVVMVIGAVGLLTNRRSLFPILLLCTIYAGAVHPFLKFMAIVPGSTDAVASGIQGNTKVFPFFVAGIAFYVYRKQIPFSNWMFGVCVIAFLAAALVPPYGLFVFPVAITYCLFWFGFHPSIRLEDWSRYGDFSYGIYLYAFPIQQLIAFCIPGVSAINLFLIATPLSVIAGVSSWFLVEKRFLKVKPRLATNVLPTFSASPVAVSQ